MRVGDAIDDAARRLGSRLEAQLLLAHAMSSERVTLLAHPEREVTPAQEQAFAAVVERRAAAEPIAYVLGEREFYGRTFRVDRRALIPRPETELLVDLGVEAVRRFGTTAVRVVEVGTGSGAVAICVALSVGCPVLAVLATDVSYEALTLARENAAGCAARVEFAQMDLVEGLRGPIHVLLANLPYVPDGRELPSDVRDYEPHVAIYGGQRGTELIERLLQDARRLLAPGGELVVELDEEEQAQPIACLARQLYTDATITIHQDGGGYDRAVRVQRYLVETVRSA
ncbi:MAG: peptide chain release factor N(5)-glutamine methyltransferase [Chloroflexi bacterium]|nr:peptide chain release factor N(5)-glutamine methyltransferase [Chloroflexota bacterium]